MRDNASFPEIKKELVESVQRCEKYILDGNKAREEIMAMVTKFHIKMYGNPEMGIEGYEERLRKLEIVESERIKSKETIFKMAVGSLTVGIGGAVIWVGQAIRDAFIKGH